MVLVGSFENHDVIMLEYVDNLLYLCIVIITASCTPKNINKATMDLIDNHVPLIYISGWKGSGKESSSYKWLEKYFSNIDCYHAGGQTDVAHMVRDLQQLIDVNRQRCEAEPILIGNSYGGFLANFFPLTQVLINPALYPSETLPHIANLSAEEIDRFRCWENKRGKEPRANVYAVCTSGDELIPNHHIEDVSLNPPVVIPGGKHRLTDQQRDQYLLPLIKEVVEQHESSGK